MHLFFNSQILPDSKQLVLPEEEMQHIVKVLRCTVGDKIQIADGKGNVYTCSINTIQGKKCTVGVISAVHYPKNRDYYLHLIVAPTKNAERMEWFVEKAVEIGIDEISFVKSANSERKELKTDRLERLLVAALKQSQTYYLPVLNEIDVFETVVKHVTQPQKLICEVPVNQEDTIKKYIIPQSEYAIMVGPEGGFSSDELAFAEANGFRAVSLGKQRLRTETAALFACVAAALANTSS
jgi:16S rRNA (uracil1498-N3)-methyltransferase